MRNSYIIFVLFLSLLFVNESVGQTSPDYIFGSDNGAGWNWATGTIGTTSVGNSYLWQFVATATTDHYVKFGESATSADGDGFWVNSAGGDMNYTGAGAKWTAYYQANMGSGGAIYWSITTGNYYIVKTKLSGANVDFAVFDNGAFAPVAISSVARAIAGTNLTVTATASAVTSANEKVWVRYSTNNWVSSTTTELVNVPTTTTYSTDLALADGNFISYYVYTTIQQAVAPAEADADFFTINYNNNGGVNYTAQIGSFSGDYYIPQNGNAKGFDKLSTAVTNINSNGMSANVNFYITGDLSESNNSFLGVNTAGFTLTIKPNADENRTITFAKATDNSATSGGLAIGLSSDSWAALVITDNIVIDGFAEGGSTRRLTLETSSAAFTAHTPIHVIGDVNNLTIKNCSLKVNQTTGTSAFGAISMRVGRWSSVDYLPDNVIVDNCVITTSTPSGGGIFISNTTSNGGAVPSGRPTGLEFKNNILTVKHRAISLNYAGTSSIYNNIISVNQPGSGFASFGIGGTNAGLVSTNVYNNKIIQLGTGNTGGGGNGIRGIQASGGGTWNIYNNFLTGFSTPASGTTEAVGIRIGSASNIYFNTIIMNNISTTGSGTTPTGGIVTYSTSCDIRNNIIITEEDDFLSYCIYASSLPATSNYNNLFRSGTVNAKIGYYAAAQADLTAWQTATSKDANSKSKAVTFVNTSTGDLHLAGASLGDVDLIADPSVGITTDIDGETRHATYPYMGADENLANVLPVELTSLNANVFGKDVKLGWATATEVNSYQFVVERNSNEVWNTIGTVNATGNSNSPKEYSFTDNSLQPGKYSYRLKMVDNDGSFEYSQTVEVDIDVPKEYVLMQNYPNPFNPVTNINYTLPLDSKVMLVIYSISGEKVAELVNETQFAGSYSIPFNASHLASGTYVYRLIANDFVQTKKMLLIK